MKLYLEDDIIGGLLVQSLRNAGLQEQLPGDDKCR